MRRWRPRPHLADLATVAAAVYDVLAIAASLTQTALTDTSTGARSVLPHLV